MVLQLEIAKIQEQNREYLSRRYHGQPDRNRHREREMRLQEIIDELMHLAKKMKAA